MLEPLALVPFIGLAMAGLIREYGFWRKEDRDFAQACKKISVIIPMRGIHPSTESNLVAITSQKVDTDVEYIFVVDSPTDPAYELAKKYGVVIISEGEGKGAALATGLKRASGDCVVFADDDINPSPRWLYLMTAPLSSYTAVTTYRWYLGRGLCHKVRLAISNMGFPAMLDKRSRFVWGGSTSFKREFAEKTRLAEKLPKYVSDDYVVYSAIKEVGGGIWFARGAIAPTPDPNCKLSEAFWWGVRQILMVKWHAPQGWYAGLIIYTLGFLISIVLPVAGFLTGSMWMLTGLLLHPINLAKDVVRALGVKRHTGMEIRLSAVLATWAVGNFVLPMAVWTSAFVKCVNWRGRRICR
ncbi:glycosyltransferase [Pyrobaculum aerophilum]|uniref:Glycosyl transferase n=2 Tax=Pyrobaculum aerophilum TaxID=13773 RepID=Q8ZVC3_PYRAE|nr:MULTISPECIES: glycosyltransferase family 2 protein [Pyrobaculum]AAL64133.1 glycosyl transferase [Pyrobaculum aerophilum str. IM2]MCX8137035.1 glycosyltransferase family 2 protein [Pyrobaculum aerophilum]HII47103.1 glycosyltransferase family 2 protein [Pyrobaculum aerophilum]